MNDRFRQLCGESPGAALTYVLLWDAAERGRTVTAAHLMHDLRCDAGTILGHLSVLVDRGLLRIEDKRPIVFDEPGLPVPDPLPAGRAPVFVRAANPDLEAQVLELHAYCNAVLGLDRKLTPGRRDKLRRRLAEFSLDDLKAVVNWVATQPFLRGQNPRQRSYDDYSTMYRSRDRVEHYLEQAQRGHHVTTLRPSEAAPEFKIL